MLFLDDLFEVQRQAIKEAKDKEFFAFFMEQGLGKTRTVLYEFHFKVTRELADCLFVVVPRSLRGTWKEEAEELGLPYPVVLVDSDKKALKALESVRGPVVLVCHYEQVQTHGRRLLEKLLEDKRKIYLALDESVRIKNHKSVIGDVLYLVANGKKRTKVSAKVSRVIDDPRGPVAFRRVLSGTPAPQGPHDLWMQFKFGGVMEKTPYYAFRNTYCRMGGYLGKQIMGAQNMDILRMRTGSFVFRAKKKDWTDLPEKLWAKPREVELTPEQRNAYREIMNEFVLELGPDDVITVEMAITVKNKLQQICSGWVYDNDKQVREIVPLDKNPKLQEVRSIIEDVETKLLVFYFFRPTREYLEQMAQDMGIDYVFLESGLKDAEMSARKARFNNEDSVKVAFCQIDAVKEGHTLLGTEAMPCHNTVFVENTYSLYARAQGEDRNHRHGQKNPVTYHDISTSKEDRAIIKALQKKGDMQEALLAEFTTYRKT